MRHLVIQKNLNKKPYEVFFPQSKNWWCRISCLYLFQQSSFLQLHYPAQWLLQTVVRSWQPSVCFSKGVRRSIEAKRGTEKGSCHITPSVFLIFL